MCFVYYRESQSSDINQQTQSSNLHSTSNAFNRQITQLRSSSNAYPVAAHTLASPSNTHRATQRRQTHATKQAIANPRFGSNRGVPTRASTTSQQDMQRVGRTLTSQPRAWMQTKSNAKIPGPITVVAERRPSSLRSTRKLSNGSWWCRISAYSRPCFPSIISIAYFNSQVLRLDNA